MKKERDYPISSNIPNEQTINAIEEAINGEFEEIIDIDKWFDQL